MRYFHNIDEVKYYETPPNKVFHDIKTCATKIWNTYDNTYGYVDEKLDAINDITNVRDNAWYIVAMFDEDNQARLWDILQQSTRDYIFSIQANDVREEV